MTVPIPQEERGVAGFGLGWEALDLALGSFGAQSGAPALFYRIFEARHSRNRQIPYKRCQDLCKDPSSSILQCLTVTSEQKTAKSRASPLDPS